VTVDLTRSGWLADLVDAALQDHDPAAARLRLPREIRDAGPEGPDLEARARMLVARSLNRAVRATSGSADEAFLAPVEGHLSLLLDLAALLEAPFDPAQRRADLAAILAAGTGELAAALKAAPGRRAGPAADGAVQRALVRAGAALLRLLHPPGDPAGGLPLFAGTVVIQRRLLARIALAYFREGTLDPDQALAELDQSRDELALLVETLAGLVAAEGPIPHQGRQLAQRQVERLGLERDRARLARARVAGPRPPVEICEAAPPRLRPFLLEQLLLASVAAPGSTAHGEYVARFAEAAQVTPGRLAEMQAEAGTFHADHAAWFRDSALPQRQEWSELAAEWNEFGERMVDRVAAVVTQNMEAIATELRETGELGTLLAKAAQGQSLDAVERRKVKDQLLDLAKAVPALAIFAAPGGLVLLPLLAKLLPFDLLPSAFQGARREEGPRRKAGLPPDEGAPASPAGEAGDRAGVASPPAPEVQAKPAGGGETPSGAEARAEPGGEAAGGAADGRADPRRSEAAGGAAEGHEERGGLPVLPGGPGAA
jgi:hypothetical protein